MRISLLLLLLPALPGCIEDDCAAYVDYMCDCHPDEEPDCETLRITYADADAALQDECAVALEDQLDADDEAGLDCPADTGT